MGDENVKVAVRVRPFNNREKTMNAKCCIEMKSEYGQVIISPPATSFTTEKKFTFDYAFDSFISPESPNYASQQTVWEALGVSVLESAWEGYNVSLFAYGQTGSGKSHSIVGFGEAKGIVPIACERIFDQIDATTCEDLSYKVETSMMEIYNEKIRDLLVDFQLQKANLKLRDSPKTGTFVEGLKKSPVNSYKQIQELMNTGTRNRTVAATQMNETSSRAHTIFIITMTQTKIDRQHGKATDKVSCINLIDLAGSERADSTGARGDRLKEGAAINVSLSALGNVISALANNANSRKKQVLVPYRNSVLTHLLKNSLGGNAKTTMIAAISPADVNYEETLSTLRYADRAKQIRNQAIVNEDPNVKMIEQLRAEVAELRRKLQEANLGGMGSSMGEINMDRFLEEERDAMRQRLEMEMAERLADMKRMIDDTNSFDQRQAETEAMMNAKENEADIHLAYITNLNEDPALSGVLKYICDKEIIRLGTKGADPPPDIILGGLGMQKDHAIITKFQVAGSDTDRLAIRTVDANARTLVNGKVVLSGEEHVLHHNDRLTFGTNVIFRVVVPAERQACEDDDMYTYDFAMKENNNDVLSLMTSSGEEEARLAAERAAMQEQMMALQKALDDERAQAALAVGAARDQLLLKQAQLEEKLRLQMEENERLSLRQEREQMERNLLDEALLRLLPLVHEGNLISQELQKGMSFAVKLISKAVRVSALTGEEEMKTEIVVIVNHSEADKTQSIWRQDKFTNRIYIMREMYHQWSENDGNLQGTEFENQEKDPFYDLPEDINIGIARLQLEAVKYLLDVDEATPLIDYKGSNQGELLVQIIPKEEEEIADLEEISEMLGRTIQLYLTIKSARGLPQKVVHDFKTVYVKFDFFLKDQPLATPHKPLNSINPVINHEIKLEQVVTTEFIEYVSSAALTLEVWASVGDQPEDDIRASSIALEFDDNDVDMKYADLQEENRRLRQENQLLREKLQFAHREIATLSSLATPRTRIKLSEALEADIKYNP